MIKPVYAGDDNVISAFKIYGGGFGHGIGMSQNAVRKMSETMSYEEILKFFYKGVEIKNVAAWLCKQQHFLMSFIFVVNLFFAGNTEGFKYFLFYKGIEFCTKEKDDYAYIHPDKQKHKGCKASVCIWILHYIGNV